MKVVCIVPLGDLFVKGTSYRAQKAKDVPDWYKVWPCESPGTFLVFEKWRFDQNFKIEEEGEE